jgi:hypothetical protein
MFGIHQEECVTRATPVLAPALTAVCFAVACSSAEPFKENVDISVCDPSRGGFSLTIDNPWFPLAVGNQWILEGTEGGKAIHLEITVLNTTVDVAGVPTLVLEEREQENGQLVEVSRNFFAQAAEGSVCYFGEDVDIYSNGVIVSHESQWRADGNQNLPGIFIPASPSKGMAFREEVAPGVAEDRAVIAAVNEKAVVPAGTFTATVRYRETSPLESGSSRKVFALNVGLIEDDNALLISRTP